MGLTSSGDPKMSERFEGQEILLQPLKEKAAMLCRGPRAREQREAPRS